MKRKIVILLSVLIIIQFIRIDKSNIPINRNKEYIVVTHAPKNVQEILKKACYDCHSNEVNYPWYADVSPFSWYIKDHVNAGREYLNFSKFGDYNSNQKQYIYKSLLKVIERQTMPLQSYVLMHKEAKLSVKDRELLKKWFTNFVEQSEVVN